MSHNPDSGGVVLSGDMNLMDLDTILTMDSSLRQIVTVPTRKDKILDVVVTNLGEFYEVPIALPPLQPDDPRHGKPSDHQGVLVSPIPQVVSKATHRSIKVRRFPENKLQIFGQIIGNEKWTFLDPNLNPTQLVELFQFYSCKMTDAIFPEKNIKISQNDKPYFTEKLQKLKRLRCREYSKNGKSEKYKDLAHEFQRLLKTEIGNYKAKIIEKFKSGQVGSIYPFLRKLAMGPNDDKVKSWHIMDQMDRHLTPPQCVEEMANFFANISQEFEPINIMNFPPNLKSFIMSPPLEALPVLNEYEVYLKIKNTRKPSSFVKGEVHPKLMTRFDVEFSAPATQIFNSIINTQEYPDQWKVEFGTPIPKTHPDPPSSLDDVRIISKTNFLSKVFEAFVLDWLLPKIAPFLDPSQFGVFKGSSTTHYLVKFLDYVHSVLDQVKPHAVLAATIDLSKAFDRVDHSLVIQDLFDMQCPSWVLRIVISYLTNRSLIVTHNGSTASPKVLTAGGPQGTRLGGFIFIVKFNGALLRPPIPRPLQNSQKLESKSHMKYFDDVTIAAKIDLKSDLIPDSSGRVRPLSFDESSELVIKSESNTLQNSIVEFQEFANTNLLKSNPTKSQAITFNFSYKN